MSLLPPVAHGVVAEPAVPRGGAGRLGVVDLHLVLDMLRESFVREEPAEEVLEVVCGRGDT